MIGCGIGVYVLGNFSKFFPKASAEVIQKDMTWFTDHVAGCQFDDCKIKAAVLHATEHGGLEAFCKESMEMKRFATKVLLFVSITLTFVAGTALIGGACGLFEKLRHKIIDRF